MKSLLLDSSVKLQEDRFLTTPVRDQLQELEKEGHITIEKFNNYAEAFYDAYIEYIQK
jgi:hypothetical protein